MRIRNFILLFGFVAAATPVAAMDGFIREADNPYQEDLAYRLGTDLDPTVEIAGVRWTHARVDTKDGEDPIPGQDNTVFTTLRFDNRNNGPVILTVVLMLEDGEGNELERLVYPQFRLGGNRVKEFRQKFKVSGDILASTRKTYLFCRVD